MREIIGAPIVLTAIALITTLIFCAFLGHVAREIYLEAKITQGGRG